MRRSENTVRDVYEMTDRLTIDLFKKGIQKSELDPAGLRGTWKEACDILQFHFGKISRIMMVNEYSLHTLYRTAVKELKQA